MVDVILFVRENSSLWPLLSPFSTPSVHLLVCGHPDVDLGHCKACSVNLKQVNLTYCVILGATFTDQKDLR